MRFWDENLFFFHFLFFLFGVYFQRSFIPETLHQQFHDLIRKVSLMLFRKVLKYDLIIWKLVKITEIWEYAPRACAQNPNISWNKVQPNLERRISFFYRKKIRKSVSTSKLSNKKKSTTFSNLWNDIFQWQCGIDGFFFVAISLCLVSNSRGYSLVYIVYIEGCVYRDRHTQKWSKSFPRPLFSFFMKDRFPVLSRLKKPFTLSRNWNCQGRTQKWRGQQIRECIIYNSTLHLNPLHPALVEEGA